MAYVNSVRHMPNASLAEPENCVSNKLRGPIASSIWSQLFLTLEREPADWPKLRKCRLIYPFPRRGTSWLFLVLGDL